MRKPMRPAYATASPGALQTQCLTAMRNRMRKRCYERNERTYGRTMLVSPLKKIFPERDSRAQRPIFAGHRP